MGFLAAAAAAILWGLVYAIDQHVLTKMRPMYLVFVSSVVSLLLSAPFVLDKGPWVRVFEVGTLRIVLVSVVLSFLASFLILYGIQKLTASQASVFEIAYPFFVVLFSWILFDTKPPPSFFLGGLLTFAGSLFVIHGTHEVVTEAYD